MKRKNSKKTGIIAAVVGLSAVTLVSVGFASWVMTGGDKAELTGNIQVDVVEDSRYTIANKASLLQGNSNGTYNITFGQPKNMSGGWLTATDGIEEHLSFTIDVIVNNMSSNKGVVTAVPSIMAGASEYGAAVSANLVCELPTISIGEKAQKESGDYSGKYYQTVTVTFKWGSHFTLNNQIVNPYTFYNAHDVDEEITAGTTYGDDAYTSLKTLEAFSTKVKFKLTITTAESAS